MSLTPSGLQQIQLHDAVLIARDADGKSHVRETTDVTPGQAGVGAGVWGLLLGTLFVLPVLYALTARKAKVTDADSEVALLQ